MHLPHLRDAATSSGPAAGHGCRPAHRAPLVAHALLLSLSASTLAMAAATPALAGNSAQASAAEMQFAIAPGPLGRVVSQFAAQAGIQLSADAALTADMASPGLNGRYSVPSGFDALLAGTGLVAVDRGDGEYTLRRAPSQGGTNGQVATLAAITVRSQQEATAYDPVAGYVAQRSATATRMDTSLNEIPQSIAVIGAQQIQDTGTQNLMDATRYTAGVTSDIFGSDNRTDAIYVRGSKAPLLENGLRSLLSQEGYAHYEPFAYERIEVLRGSAGMIAGSNPPGGILNLVSKRPLDRAGNEVFVQYGSHDHKKIGADLTGPMDEDGKWLYRVIAVGLDSSSQTHRTKRENAYAKPMVTWNPTRSTSVTAYAEYARNEMNTETPFLPYEGTIFDRPIGKVPASIFIGEPDWDKTVGTRTRAGWELTQKLGEDWELKQRFRHTSTDSHLLGMYANWWDGYFNEAGDPDPNGEYLKRIWYERRYKIDLANTDLLLNGKARTGSLEHNLLFAGNFDKISTRQGSDEGDYPALNVYDPVYGAGTRPSPATRLTKTTNKTWALTIQDQIKIDGRFIVNLGLRYDKLYNYDYANSPASKQQEDNYSKSIGVLWLAGHGFSPYASYSESFEPYYGMNRFDGSLLRPKDAKQLEAGLKWQNVDGTLTANMAAYKTKSRNMLTLDPAHPGYFLQAGEQEDKGFELELAARLGYWDIIAQYTHTKSETIKGDALTGSDVGVQTEGIPKNTASLWAVHDLAPLGLPNLRVGMGARYTDRITNGLSKENGGLSVPSRTLFDAMASYENGPIRLALNVNNLTNKKYVSICESGGRCWYGNERTVIGTLSYKF